MPQTADTIKTIEGALGLGFTLAEAVQRALGKSLSAFGAQYGHRPSEVSMCLNGYEGRVYPEIRDNLCREEELNVPREYLDSLIDRYSKRSDKDGGDAVSPAA